MDIWFCLTIFGKTLNKATMKTILRKLAYYIVPLLIPVIEQLIADAIEEAKRKLSEQLKSESAVIQNQLRDRSDSTRIF